MDRLTDVELLARHCAPKVHPGHECRQRRRCPEGAALLAEVERRGFAQMSDGRFEKVRPVPYPVMEKDDLRGALLEYGLLLLRAPDMTPAEQVRLTLRFGTGLIRCSPRFRFLASEPAVFVVANTHGFGNLDIGRYWHCEGAYLAEPTPVAVHRIVEGGGATLFADLARAYEVLPAKEKAVLAGWSTVAQSGIRHAVVQPHPVSGRRSLYINLDPGARIVDASDQEVPQAKDRLRSCLDQLCYRHEWRAGDVLISDQFRIAHCALPVQQDLRVLHRTTVHAPTVRWRA